MSYYPSPVQGSAPSAPPGGAAAFYGAYGGGTPPAPAAAPPQQGGQQQYQQQGQQHATLQAPLPLSAYYPQQPAQQPPQQRQQQAPVPYRPDMFSSLGGAGDFAPAPGAASPPGGAAGGVTQSFGVNLLSEEGFAPQRCVCEVSLEGLVLKQDGRVVKSYELEAIIRWSLYPKVRAREREDLRRRLSSPHTHMHPHTWKHAQMPPNTHAARAHAHAHAHARPR